MPFLPLSRSTCRLSEALPDVQPTSSHLQLKSAHKQQLTANMNPQLSTGFTEATENPPPGNQHRLIGKSDCGDICCC